MTSTVSETTTTPTTPLYVSDPEKWLQRTIDTPDLVCILFFRGSWCKYDRFYLRELGKFVQQQQHSQEKVKLIAWTSEGAQGAQKANQEWRLTTEFGFDAVIGDESNALANYFKDFLTEEEILGDLEILPLADLNAGDNAQKAVGTYPHGVALPCMLWYAHHGSLVLEWASTNKGGPGRPDLPEMWQKIVKRQKALEHGNATMPAHGKCKLCADDVQVTLSQCNIL